MKNLKMYSIVITIVAIGALAGLGYFFWTKDGISENEAKLKAFEYANVIEDDITISKTKKDLEEQEYEITFYDKTYEYELEIDMKTGNIVNFEKDVKDKVNIVTDNSEATMSEDNAKDIATKYMGTTTKDVKFRKAELDKENGIMVYELEFYDDNYNYEVNVSLNDGSITKYTKKEITTKKDTTNNKKEDTTTTKKEYIGTAKAKEIALKHANLSSSDVKWHKTELDVDYNLTTYELEFIYNNLEYEYEINAYTGAIIKYEIDR